MPAVLTGGLGPAPALLLLAALLASCAAQPYTYNIATTAECAASNLWLRVRHYPTDGAINILSLSNCALSNINPDSFTGLPHLKILELENNLLEHINLSVFYTVELEILRLSNNKLREMPVLDENWCPSEKLNLFGNQLPRINNERTFSACARLHQLHLSYNHIDYVHPDIFKPLTELKWLDLDNNKISFIPDQMFSGNSNLRSLALFNNRITHLASDFVGQLKRTAAGLDRFIFYNNPWHCACFLEVLADVKRIGLSDYRGWGYNGNGTQRVCVYTGAVPCCRQAPSRLLRPGR